MLTIRTWSSDGAEGVFVGELDKTDEFLMLTPTGATKRIVIKRLVG